MSNPAEKQYAPPFPIRHQSRPPLALPRRVRTPADLVAAPRPESAPGPDPEADRFYRHLQEALTDRERAIADAEVRLLERTRDLDEIDALLRAREALLASTRLREPGNRNLVTSREAQAVMDLKAELDRQEASLREAREAIREREKFLDESEQRLFEKVQQQQEKESELEQREENLKARQENAANSGGANQVRDEFRE